MQRLSVLGRLIRRDFWVRLTLNTHPDPIPSRRNKFATVLLAFAVLSLSLLAMHAPLISTPTMRHLSNSAKMDEPGKAVDVASPRVPTMGPVGFVARPPVPPQFEFDSPAPPVAPSLGAHSLRAPPRA